MKFRTEIEIPENKNKITYNDAILSMGSCFAENIAQYLKSLQLDMVSNPYGILFNPVSIYNSIHEMISGKIYGDDDIMLFNDKWLSLNHHGSFSNKDKNICLENINNHILEGSAYLKKSRFLFITLGTSIVYVYEQFDKVVGNCHKIPQKFFNRLQLSLNQTITCLQNIINEVRNVNETIDIVFTVSPIRHIKDGLHENTISKATLLLAIDEMVKHNDNVSYFPAYEILIDDLRDYRFYDEDMLHPNPTAVNYVLAMFKNCFVDKTCFPVMDIAEKLYKAKQHRIDNKDNTIEMQKFQDHIATLEQELRTKLYDLRK